MRHGRSCVPSDYFVQPHPLPQRQFAHWQFGPHSQWLAFFDIGISSEPG